MDGPCGEFYIKRDYLWKNFMMSIISNVLSVSFEKQKSAVDSLAYQILFWPDNSQIRKTIL